MHWRVITEHFDPLKTSGLLLVVEHFMVLSKFLRRNLYITFKRDTLVFFNENLGNLTLIVEKTTPKLPFGR